MDRDESLDPRELLREIALIVLGRRDLALGRLCAAPAPADPRARREPGALAGSSAASRLEPRDPAPTRASRARPLRSSDRRPEVRMARETGRRGAGAARRFGEVEVVYRPRAGQSKVTGSFGALSRRAGHDEGAASTELA